MPVDRNRAREATDRALVAHQAVAFHLDAKQQRVVVAVGGGRDDAQAVAAGFALHPQLLAGAAPEGDEAGLQRFGVADGVQKAQHQHFAGARILHDAGHQAIHFFEVDCCSRVAHSFILSEICRQSKKPASVVAGGLWCFLISLAV